MPPTLQTTDRRLGLRRTLGPFDATCIVVGAIIGVGIFLSPAEVAKIAGSSQLTLLAWAAGGVIALAGAFTFASLGAAYSGPGAQYEALREAYGPFPAFLFVFCNATAIQAGATALIAITCAQNLGVTVSGTALSGRALLACATALILGLTGANCIGVRWGAAIQNVTVVAKLAVLAAIVLLAYFSAGPPGTAGSEPAAAGTTPVSGFQLVGVLFAALGPAAFTYGGWQHALWVAGEVRQPRRNVPLAILVGVTIVIVAYMLTNWAYLRLLGYSSLTGSQTVAADAVTGAWPLWGRRIIAAGVTISALGVLNDQLLCGPRLVYRLAEDGRFFAVFGRVSGQRATPIAAILLIAGLALAVLLAAFVREDYIEQLLAGVVSVDGIFFVLTGLVPFIRSHSAVPGMGPDRVRPGFGYPWPPVIFVIGEAGVVLGAYRDQAQREAALIGLGWIVVAAALYFARFRRTSPSI